jgi:hypothetical protein
MHVAAHAIREGLDRQAFLAAMEDFAESLTEDIEPSIMIEFTKAMRAAR